MIKNPEVFKIVINNQEHIPAIIEYTKILTNKNYQILNGSYKLFNYVETQEDLKSILNNTLSNLNTLEQKGRNKEFIQNFLNSNFYIFYQYIPKEIKENKELLAQLSKKFTSSVYDEQEEMIRKIKEINFSKDVILVENKIKLVELCLLDKVELENKKMSTILKGLPLQGIFLLQKELNLRKEQSKKNSYINNILKQKEELEKKKNNHKNIDEKNTHIYNQEYYDFIKDPKLARSKIDIIKHAYFQNGVNLNEFKENLGRELYKCSPEQLENYVQVYTRYKDNYLSREEFYFSKKIIKEDQITQEEIKEDVLPIIEKCDLTERQVKECIDIGADRKKGDTKKYLDLVIEAKEHKYSNFEINEILEDCREEPTKTAYLKKELIEEYGKDNITSVDNLKNYEPKEIEVLLKDKELARELNEQKEITHDDIGVY